MKIKTKRIINEVVSLAGVALIIFLMVTIRKRERQVEEEILDKFDRNFERLKASRST